MAYARTMTLFAKILVISDSLASGERVDVSGPLLHQRLVAAGYEIVELRVVPDGLDSVAEALNDLARNFAGLVVTTGGTGFAPRDLTPEATRSVLERPAPGFDELMRATHPLGALSRGSSGAIGSALVLNTPGSPKGAVESLEAVLALVPHALELLSGRDSAHPPAIGGSTATSS